jgi:peptidoglycan/LPS O-acetylase OafA/YrhL
VLTTLTFTNGWNIRWINRMVPGGWSIAVEMNFYLLVPLFFQLIRNRRAAVISVLAALGGAVAAKFAVTKLVPRLFGPDWYGGFQLPTIYWLPLQMPIFCLGFTLFFIIKPLLRGGGERSGSSIVDAWLLLALSGYLIVATSFSSTNLYLGHMLFGVAFLILGWSLYLYPNPLLVNGPTRYLGKVSYSAYLTHFVVLDVIGAATKRGPVRVIQSLPPTPRFFVFLALVLAGTLVVSTITHNLIENPGINAGRRLIRKLESLRRREEVAAR